MRCHYTSFRMTEIQNTTSNTGRMWSKNNNSFMLMGIQNGTATLEITVEDFYTGEH